MGLSARNDDLGTPRPTESPFEDLRVPMFLPRRAEDQPTGTTEFWGNAQTKTAAAPLLQEDLQVLLTYSFVWACAPQVRK